MKRLGVRAAGLLAVFAAAFLLFAPVQEAEAKFGRGFGKSFGKSFGSRGSRTYTRPPATRTAPRSAQPIQRSATPATAARSAAAGAGARRGMFGSTMSRGFLGGLVGAGLLGLLFGYGLSGGLGSLASILGLLLQIGLIVLAVSLFMSWWRGRQQPALAGAGGRNMAGNSGGMYGAGEPPRSRYDTGTGRSAGPTGPGTGPMSGLAMSNGSMNGSGASSGGPGGGRPGQEEPLQLQEGDYDTFERMLNDVQTAYAEEDMDKLKKLATEEMCGYFAEDIEDNIEQGYRTKISGVKLLQGDLAEAWKEPDSEWATVSMRFSITDAVVERKTGKVVEGSLTEPQELIEYWTFSRKPNGTPQDWLLAAVQQEDGEDDEEGDEDQQGSHSRH